MVKRDERGVVVAAPLQFNNPASITLPRHDDEHRGLAVLDSYELSRCWIDLMEDARGWSLPPEIPPHLAAIAESIPEDQRLEWLGIQLGSEEVTRIISYAMRSGELPIWIAPKDGQERLVAASAMIEVDHATVVSGCYCPPNDRGWLYGRPLFVKRDDWVQFATQVRARKSRRRESTMTHEEVVRWCKDWIEGGKGSGMDAAWEVFRDLPRRNGLSRDDNFRPAWNAAKTMSN